MSTRFHCLFSWIEHGPAMRRRGGCGVVAALLLLGSPGGAMARESPITWAIYDAPPFMIKTGPDREKGIFDQIRHLLDDRLFGAASPILQAPFPRVLSSLKDGAELCFIGGVKVPERDAFAVFSLPVAMFYPLRIVVHTPERGRFDARAPLSLATLLADRDLRTSVLRDRSLGGSIDALIRQAPPSHVHSEFAEAFRMLIADRLDYLVEYAAITAYGAKGLGQSGAFTALPFTEAPAPVLSRVMCPKTDWGRGVVARVDAILRQERRTAEYRHIVESWVEDGDRATIREAYDRFFVESE